MSLFSQEVFLKQVRSLVPTQEKIKTVALYMRTFASSSTKMVQILDKDYETSNSFQKLNILYLANELILNIRKSDSDLKLLLEQMRTFVTTNFNKTYKEMENHKELFSKLNDLQRIWFNRKIFTKEDFEYPSQIYGKNNKNDFSETIIENSLSSSMNTYTRSEILEKINNFFDQKELLADYLEAMVKMLRKDQL